jgi:hypothetical protein
VLGGRQAAVFKYDKEGYALLRFRVAVSEEEALAAWAPESHPPRNLLGVFGTDTVQVYVARVLEQNVRGHSLCLVEALGWMLDEVGVDVLNLSLGTPNPAMMSAMHEVVERAVARGATLFIAAGGVPTLPAQLQSGGGRGGFSARGPAPRQRGPRPAHFFRGRVAGRGAGRGFFSGGGGLRPGAAAFRGLPLRSKNASSNSLPVRNEGVEGAGDA